MIQDKEEKLQTIINSKTVFIVEHKIQKFRIDFFFLVIFYLLVYFFLACLLSFLLSFFLSFIYFCRIIGTLSRYEPNLGKKKLLINKLCTTFIYRI